MVVNYGSAETKAAVLKNEMSINRAYQKTQKERKQAEAEPSVQNSGQQTSEEGQKVEQADEDKESARVAPVLLSLYLFGALHELGGSVEDHVTLAIEQYLESLVGAHETNPTESYPGNVKEDEDEDDEIFDPDNYEAD
jgi:hypothetical protein